MPFAKEYDDRFTRIIEPAVEAVTTLDGEPLKAFRVDEAQSGECIVTQIMDGIALSQLVLADVSTVWRDPDQDLYFRNANVMLEVGIALAARTPEEVVLLRGDKDPGLFDIGTIRYVKVDFADVDDAIATIADELKARLDRRKCEDDVRAELALRGLGIGARGALKQIATHRGEDPVTFTGGGGMWGAQILEAGLDQVLVQQLVTAHTDGRYRLTWLGRAVWTLLEKERVALEKVRE